MYLQTPEEKTVNVLGRKRIARSERLTQKIVAGLRRDGVNILSQSLSDISIEDFTRQYTYGVYLAVTKNHAFAVKDGTVYDLNPSPKDVVIGVWRLFL